MRIAVLGTGRMGRALVKTLYPFYADRLLFAGRDQSRTARALQELNLPMQASTEEEALQADVIIPTFWFNDFQPWLSAQAEKLKGRIVIDITNPFNESFDDFTIGYDTSSAEILQSLAPGVHIAGAFKNTYWVVFDNPVNNGIYSDIYVTANDETVRQKVISLLKPLPFRVFDAGGLKNNRTIERMTLLERELAIKAGHHPRVSFHLWGGA